MIASRRASDLRTDTAGTYSSDASTSDVSLAPCTAASAPTASCIVRRNPGTSSAPARVFGFDNHAIVNSVARSEEHTSELQSRENLVCRLLLEKKKKTPNCQ